ncbi:hypothetical protein GBS42_11115, partial [Escherichia coli]|nr:hypothetical protein [Escherichia coli]
MLSWRCPSLLTPVWSPHLLKLTPMMPMTPPNWRTMRQPFLRILRWFPTLSRSSRMSSLRKQTLLLHWPVQWLCQPSLWLLKRMMRRFLPIFRRRWHWLRPARHLLTRHWQMMQPLFLSLPQLRHSVPLPFQKTWRSSRTSLPPSRNFLPPLPRKLHYWHLMMHSFLKISLPLLRPPHPVPRWQLLTPSWSLWMQKWLPIFV